MTREDGLRPRLGRIRQQQVQTGPFQAELGRALGRSAPRPAGAHGASSRARRLGRLFAGSLGRRSGQRRVVVKVRLVRLGGDGRSAVQQHLRYLQRDGVARDGDRGPLYGPAGVEVEPGTFIERGAEDRHQFRIILAPEDGLEMGDLRPFVRDVVAQMEKDLDTRLEWVAVDHFDSAHPHSHVLVRGVDEAGHDLVIARGYLSHGLRFRASEAATRELGLRGEREVERSLYRQVDQERVTDIDRSIDRQVAAAHVWDQKLGNHTPVERALAQGRLRHLAQMGLAEELAPGRWRLSENWLDQLKAMGERGDIQRAVHRGLKRAGLDQGLVRFASHDLAKAPAAQVEGIVIDKGLHDEHTDRPYVLVDGIDGRAHYVVLASRSPLARLEIGQVFEPNRRRGLTPEQQVAAEGPTWLDRRLAGQGRPFANPRLEAMLAGTFARRLDQLKAWGLAHVHGDGGAVQLADDLLSALRQREVDGHARALAREFAKPCAMAFNGEQLTGEVRRLLELHSGPYALIDQGRSLSLVPASLGMAQRLGRRIRGTLTHNGFVMTKGRHVSLPDMD